MDSSSQAMNEVEAFQIGEGSSQASSNTIIQMGNDCSQDDEDATPPPSAIQNGDRSSLHANDSTPPDTDVHRKLQDVKGKLSCCSDYQKRSLMKEMDKAGMCPLHLAAKEGYHLIIKQFIQSMPNCVDIRNKDGKTALHIAVENGQLEAVKMLLLNKEARNVRKMVSDDCDKEGNTALHLAAMREADMQIVRELLKLRGLSVNAINKEGLTALDIAAHSSAVLSQDDRHSKCAEMKTILEAVGGCGRYSRQSEGKESKIVDVDTVVASLIAAITFAAIFQIPGGMNDDENSSLYGGARNLLDPAFLWFSGFNTLALFTSLTVVMMWLLRQRLPGEYTNRSKVAGLSAICLGISILCTGLASLCAFYLVATPFSDSPPMAEEDVSKYKCLFWVVVVAACIAPVLAWTTYMVTLVYKFYHLILTRTPDPIFFC